MFLQEYDMKLKAYFIEDDELLNQMKNIELKNSIAVSGNQCTLFYYCVNNCPKQAITLLVSM